MIYGSSIDNDVEYFGYIPSHLKSSAYQAVYYLAKVRMHSSKKQLLKDIMSAVGYIVTKSLYGGTAILISPNYVLVSAHCFKTEKGYINFSGKPRYVEVAYQGDHDFKILKLQNQISDITPALLMVSVNEGRSLQLFYRADSNLWVKEYTSESFGSYSGRSDISDMRTSPGESGGGRYSLTHSAIHAIHQGDREALKMNDIIRELQQSARYNLTAKQILAELNILDLPQLGLQASTISLRPNSVRPEGPQQKITIRDDVPFVNPTHPLSERNYRDSIEAIEQLNFPALWRDRGAILYNRSVRIDVQNRTATHVNIQIQLNGVRNAATTFATLLLDLRFEEIRHADQQQAILNKVKAALKNGVYEGYSRNQFIIKIIDLPWQI